MHTLECVNVVRKKQLTKLELKDQTILRIIMGPVKEEGKYIIKHNKEFYQPLETITAAMKKSRLIFYDQDEKPGTYIESLQQRLQRECD